MHSPLFVRFNENELQKKKNAFKGDQRTVLLLSGEHVRSRSEGEFTDSPFSFDPSFIKRKESVKVDSEDAGSCVKTESGKLIYCLLIKTCNNPKMI